MNFLIKIPDQIKRLLIIVIILFFLFILMRALLVPKDFGEIGHYRKQAIYEIVAQEIKYAGQEVCMECHDDVLEIKQNGYHKNLNCEVCHGPSASHADNPDEFIPEAPRQRNFCPVCHEYLSSRPTGFPQIISKSHNPVKVCISCHEPHNPVPPQTPSDCSACHAEISRTKSLSHHAYVSCTNCHNVPDKHKTSPREYLPTKPTKREFCGNCHSTEVTSQPGIPKVELTTHETRYVCWQCHYPHLPEAR